VDVPYAIAVRLAVEGGLAAAAILDVEGKPLAVAGALDDDEARAIEAVVTRRLRSPDLLGRMLEGEMMTSLLDEREVSIGIAASCVFVVVVLGRDPAASRVAVDELRSDLERMISDARADVSGSRRPPPSGSGGSSSGPAELPVIELGVTVRRRN
jgi:hypothetical protein